ncbi:MAG: saccharopine dehydrogenase C-terminal domain-containing protein [Lacibacter sp.]
MKTILLLGAGKSATVLIAYLSRICAAHHWKLVVADASYAAAASKLVNPEISEAVELDITDETARRILITEASVVISLLPPHLHIHAAHDCVAIGRHLLTASYVDEAMRRLQDVIRQKELLFLCEMGLDPGIDHMSALQLLAAIQTSGGTVTGFLSHCGGLVAPESDNNPWHYKISWNPRNIVRAGSSGARYLFGGKEVEKSYKDVFQNCPTLSVPGLPSLSWYPNRDSLSYLPLYQLTQLDTFIRTTLRFSPFCTGWNAVVQLGLTDETDAALLHSCTTLHQWLLRKIQHTGSNALTLQQYLQANYPGPDAALIEQQFNWLQLQAAIPLPPHARCSADLLQHQMEQHLRLDANDKDLVVMVHEAIYRLQGALRKRTSRLVVQGADSSHTAMATTVGLPLGIAARLLLEDKIPVRGLHIPILPEIYRPVLAELAQEGIVFEETDELMETAADY